MRWSPRRTFWFLDNAHPSLFIRVRPAIRALLAGGPVACPSAPILPRVDPSAAFAFNPRARLIKTPLNRVISLQPRIVRDSMSERQRVKHSGPSRVTRTVSE
jgi:hypothetical protein